MTHGSTFFRAVSGAPWAQVAPLARVLEVALSPESATITSAHARTLWKELSYLGSNHLAYLLRGFEGVDYPEIVRDVGKQLNVVELQPGETEEAVELNEQLVIAKIIADHWEPLDVDRRRDLLRALNLDERHLSLPGAAVAAAVLEGRAGPFAVYKLSRIAAKFAERALPSRGLARARRKVAYAVVLVASLRQAQHTALAKTALVDADGPNEPPADRTARPRKHRPLAREKTAPRPPEQRKKKAAEPPRAAPKRSAKKKATAKKATAKNVPKKKAGAKKARATKASGTSKSAKKKKRTK